MQQRSCDVWLAAYQFYGFDQREWWPLINNLCMNYFYLYADIFTYMNSDFVAAKKTAEADSKWKGQI